MGSGAGPPPSPGRSAPTAPARACRPGSDLHECDLETFHHALHVEDEGVLIGVVLNNVVVHVYQDAGRDEGEEGRDKSAMNNVLGKGRTTGWGSPLPFFFKGGQEGGGEWRQGKGRRHSFNRLSPEISWRKARPQFLRTNLLIPY